MPEVRAQASGSSGAPARILERLCRDLVVQVRHTGGEGLVLAVMRHDRVDAGGEFEGMFEKRLIELVEQFAAIDPFLEIKGSRQGVFAQFVQQGLDETQIVG